MIKHDIIKRFADIHPEKPALIKDDKIINWSEFKSLTENLLVHLQEYNNYDDGAPWLFISTNTIELVLMSAACATLGIPFQGIDYNLDPLNVGHLVKKLKSKYVFVSQDFQHKYSSLGEVCHLVTIENLVSLDVSPVSDPNVAVRPIKCRKFSSYGFTSGTTGLPKIVYRSKPFDKQRFDYLVKRYSFTNKDCHLVCLPMYHASSTGWLRLFLNLGCSAVIHDFKDGYTLCETIYSHRISTALMSPYMLKQMTKGLAINDGPNLFPALRFIITGGKNCPTSVKRQAIRKLGHVIYEYYGTTETGVNTLLDPHEALNYSGSVGRSFEGNDIQIVDGNKKPIATGMTGRIVIHSYMNMDGYLNHENEFIIIDGKRYILTSDYGYKNKENYLFVVQRSSGQPKQIYDFHALENEILNLDYVDDVSIVDANHNGVVKVSIIPRRFQQYQLIYKDVIKKAKKYQVNNLQLHICSNLDYTPTGKIKLQLNQAA